MAGSSRLMSQEMAAAAAAAAANVASQLAGSLGRPLPNGRQPSTAVGQDYRFAYTATPSPQPCGWSTDFETEFPLSAGLPTGSPDFLLTAKAPSTQARSLRDEFYHEVDALANEALAHERVFAAEAFEARDLAVRQLKKATRCFDTDRLALEEECQTLEERVVAMQRSLSSSIRRGEKEGEAAACVSRHLHDACGEMRTMEAALRKVTTVCGDRSRENTQLQARTAELQFELSTMTGACQDCQRKVDAQRAQISDYSNELADACDEEHSLARELEEERFRLADCEDTLMFLSRREAEILRQHNAHHTSMTALEEELAQNDARMTGLEARLSEQQPDTSSHGREHSISRRGRGSPRNGDSKFLPEELGTRSIAELCGEEPRLAPEESEASSDDLCVVHGHDDVDARNDGDLRLEQERERWEARFVEYQQEFENCVEQHDQERMQWEAVRRRNRELERHLAEATNKHESTQASNLSQMEELEELRELLRSNQEETEVAKVDALETKKSNEELKKRLTMATLEREALQAKVSRSDAGAVQLRSKGFTVRQLLSFYDHYRETGQIQQCTSTNAVVRNVVIPETANPPRCYMDSDFMQSIGGGNVARKLVSHAWLSEFVNTVLNIVLDASGRSNNDFTAPTEWNKHEAVYHDGVLDATRLMSLLSSSALAKTYWLCIFAVNEHHAICGDCWRCNQHPVWQQDVTKHLQAEICLICEQPKFNPCVCGSQKYLPGHPDCEIDLFDHVVGHMDALVVSLDADLNSIKRVWVVAEIGRAMQNSTVLFRLATGLSTNSIDRLVKGEDLMPSVQDCDATSPADKERILSGIREIDGGILAYDQFINCMLELSFGILSRVPKLQGAAVQAAAKLQHLEMDFTWQEALTALPDCSYFPNLQTLTMNCLGLKSLVSIDEFGKGLGRCHGLVSVTSNFWGCGGIASIDELGRGLCQCHALASATLIFFGCTGLANIDEFGKCLGQCQALSSAVFNFNGCENLTSIDEFGRCLGRCQALASATFDFWGCLGLSSIDEFGKGLSECQALASADFHFNRCPGLTSIDEFGKGLGQCQALASADFHFNRCQRLTSIDEFGKGLGQSQVLASADFHFNRCIGLTSIDEFGKGLGQCQALASATFNFHGCANLVCVDGVGLGLGRCQVFSSGVFSFQECTSLTSIDEFGKGIGQCQALTSVVVELSRCSGLTSIDELGKGLGQCRVLATASLDLTGCPAITSLDEFGNSLGQCQCLSSLALKPEHLVTPEVMAALPPSCAFESMDTSRSRTMTLTPH